MSGDFSRLTFDQRKHFDAVLMQQGRPQLDADWNEQQAIHIYRRELQTRDLVGQHGAPREHAGFDLQLRAALDFDGQSQSAHVASSGTLHGTDLDRFTLEMRVTLLTDHASAGTLASSQRAPWRLQVESDGRLAVYLGHEETPVLITQTALPFGVSTDVSLSCHGEWMRISSNGQIVGEATCPVNGGAHSSPMSFGGAASRRASGGQFRGQLESISLRDGRHNLVASWPMVGVQRDQLLRDATGNDNDLELSASTPRWVARELRVGHGRMYVNGIVCENERSLTVGAPAVSRCVAYLDVWKREIDAVSAPDLREVALGGADTAIRSQVTWRVRTLELDASADDADWHTSWQGLLDDRATTGALRVQHQAAAGLDVGNQLYRIEIHRAGSVGEATFKWSRDNASNSFAVMSVDSTSGIATLVDLGHDSYALQDGDWVEYLDDTMELERRPGPLLQVAGIDRARTTVTLAGGNLAQLEFEPTAHPRLRRWDQGETGADVTIPDNPETWVTLENGIQISFASGSYQAGDYWLVATRSALQDVHWPVNTTSGPLFEPPAGVRHHYCPLALVDLSGDEPRVRDERRLFDALTALRAAPVEHRGEPARERDLQLQGDLTVQGDAHMRGHVHVGHLSGELAADLVDTEQLVDGAVTRAKLAPDVDVLPAGVHVLGISAVPPPGYAHDGASLVVDHPGRHHILDVDEPGNLSGVAIDRLLYLVSDLGTVWAYDLGDEHLREVARIEHPRPELRAVAVSGRLLILGGLDSSGAASGRVSELDTRELTWHDRSPVPSPRREAGFGVLGTDLHVLGGVRPTGEPVPRHDVYDVEHDSWSTRADLPAPRHGVIAAGVSGRLIVIGSERRGRQWRGAVAAARRTDEFDPRRDRWFERSPLPGSAAPLATLASNQQLVVLAQPVTPEGRTAAPRVAERWTYDPETDWWSQRSPLRRPANGLAMARAGSTLYAIGSDGPHIHITSVWQTLYVHRRL